MSLSGREVTLLAWAAVATSLLLAWLSRNTLNPDGVSYLDLARVLMSGDRAPFVQGYWSPLYPALVAMLSVVTAGSSAAWIAAAHVLNGIVAIAAAVLLWRWTLRAARPLLARFVFAAFLIAARGCPESRR